MNYWNTIHLYIGNYRGGQGIDFYLCLEGRCCWWRGLSWNVLKTSHLRMHSAEWLPSHLHVQNCLFKSRDKHPHTLHPAKVVFLKLPCFICISVFSCPLGCFLCTLISLYKSHSLMLSFSTLYPAELPGNNHMKTGWLTTLWDFTW